MALRKLTALLRLHLARRLPSRRLRSSAFSDRPVRPRPIPPPQPPQPPPLPQRCRIVKDYVNERDQNFIDDSPHIYEIVKDNVDERDQNFIDDSLHIYEIVEDDVDERAQNFIDDTRRRLWLERQISRQLKYYYRSSSCGTEYEDASPLRPPPPPPPPR